MANSLSLEDLLRDKASAHSCANCAFWDNYAAMKKYLATNYYPWIQANSPWFTDHGEKHVDSVIHATNQMLAGREAELSCLDAYLLLVAIIWHDVGMVSIRSGHAKQVQVFIDKVREFCFPDQSIYRLVTLITRAHSGRDGWDLLDNSEQVSPCTHQTCTVYPRSLAAVLRFADEASEARTRISPVLIPQVPLPQRVYWEYAHAITASTPEPARQRLVLAIELQRSAAADRFPCPSGDGVASHADADGTISLIEYIVCRLEKMNNERAYCFPYLTRYADIRNIEVRIRVCEGVDCHSIDGILIGDDGLSKAGYPSIELFSRFFEAYPQLVPTALVGGTDNGR